MPTPAEIETIVRKVLATLTADGTTVGNAVSNVPKLSVEDQVVSLQLLKNRLEGMKVLEIGKLAVLTPAARDHCVELKVEIRRIGETEKSKSDSPLLVAETSSRPQRLIVAGSPLWINSVAKQLCAKQANVCGSTADDASAMRTIADGLRAGHQAGLAIVSAPHAACWQAARDDRLRPAVVSTWTELNEVLREVPVNVLIVSARTWNVPSICNVARRFFQHLQIHS